MKAPNVLLVVISCCALSGCARKVRSISQSGFQDNINYAGACSRELDEFDVLGLDRDKPVTEEEIQRVSRQSQPVQLAPGCTILLIQSGAVYPDGPMVTELSKRFRVVPFTGVATERESKPEAQLREQTIRHAAVITDPNHPVTLVPLTTLARQSYRTEPAREEAGAYSRVLRLAAARAGASAVVCYWGILESGEERVATKTIAWIPMLNWVVPDERQHLRIRLKIAMVDVATGSWSVFGAQPLETRSWSVKPRREVADQKQVEDIKQKAYELAARDLISAYVVR